MLAADSGASALSAPETDTPHFCASQMSMAEFVDWMQKEHGLAWEIMLGYYNARSELHYTQEQLEKPSAPLL